MPAAPRLALATQPSLPDLWLDARRLIPALARHGIRAEPAVWSSEMVGWRAFDGVVIRSCWDYFEDYPRFRRWLDTLDALRIRTWNGSDVLRWNTDKSYLLELAAAGVPVIETELLNSPSVADIEALAAARGWERVVVKPAVSANGANTMAVSPAAARAAPEVQAVAGASHRGRVLVQPFAPEIAADGEWSLVFIDGEYSHAVIKRPGSGDFRVQVSHGGTDEPATPPDWMIREASAALAASGQRVLYARVDGIARDGRFVLMELELTEPNLYFEFSPASVERMAAALARELA